MLVVFVGSFTVTATKVTWGNSWRQWHDIKLSILTFSQSGDARPAVNLWAPEGSRMLRKPRAKLARIKHKRMLLADLAGTSTLIPLSFWFQTNCWLVQLFISDQVLWKSSFSAYRRCTRRAWGLVYVDVHMIGTRRLCALAAWPRCASPSRWTRTRGAVETLTSESSYSITTSSLHCLYLAVLFVSACSPGMWDLPPADLPSQYQK